MQTTTKKRAIPRAAGVPEVLLGHFGEQLDRGAWAWRAPDGKSYFVGISSEGKVVAAKRMPRAAHEPVDRERFDFFAITTATERWTSALAEVWLAVEVLDPAESAASYFPELRDVPRMSALAGA